MAAKNSRARMQNPTCKYTISKEAESKSNKNSADFASMIEKLVELSI